MPMYVPATGGGGGIPDAPVNTSPYVRMNGAWSRTFIARPYDSGAFYQPDIGLTYAAGAAIAANTHRFIPIVFYRDAPIAELGARVTTLIASSSFQLAIYAATGVGGAPDGPPLVQTGAMSGATATALSAPVTSPATLPAGVYWGCVITDTAGIVFLTNPAAVGNAPSLFGGTSLSDVTNSATINTYAYSLAGTYGTWPTISGTASKVFSSTTIQTASVFWRAQ